MRAVGSGELFDLDLHEGQSKCPPFSWVQDQSPGFQGLACCTSLVPGRAGVVEVHGKFWSVPSMGVGQSECGCRVSPSQPHWGGQAQVSLSLWPTLPRLRSSPSSLHGSLHPQLSSLPWPTGGHCCLSGPLPRLNELFVGMSGEGKGGRAWGAHTQWGFRPF